MQSNGPRILVVYPSVYAAAGGLQRDEVKSTPWVLASYLSQFFDVTYADFEASIGQPSSPVQVKRFERKVREYFEEHRFDLIAISCWTSMSYRAAWAVATVARAVNHGAIIAIGGYHASARPDDFINPSGIFDYIVQGEGELALQEIANGYRAGRPSAAKIIDGPPLPAEQLAPVDWRLIEPVIRQEYDGNIGTLTFFLSRGCPFSCAFCVESLKDSRWRAFSPELAVAQIRQALEKHKFNALGIGDACFGVQPSWRKKFLRLLADLNPSTWILLETRAEYLDDEDIALLARMKIEIQIGVESCSPAMLGIMNKTKQPEKFLKSFRDISHKLSDNGIIHGANLIFNHPGETEQTLRETFAFMDEELKRQNTSLMWACHGYMHFPGSELNRNEALYAETYGARFDTGEWWKTDEDPYIASRRVTSSHDLSGERGLLWKTMLEERKEAMKASLTSRAFGFAAETYFLDWQLDVRYEPTPD